MAERIMEEPSEGEIPQQRPAGENVPPEVNSEVIHSLEPQIPPGGITTTEILHSLSPGDRLSEQPPPQGPRDPEDEGGEYEFSPEHKEILPPFEFVVERIRKLEAMNAHERYAPGENNSYPVLKELELRFTQFEKYASIMETPDIAELRDRSEFYFKLEEGLANGETTNEQLLQLVDQLGSDDPIIRNLKKQKDIFKEIKNPTVAESTAFRVIEQQLNNVTTLEGSEGVKEKLKVEIEHWEQELAGRSRQSIEQRLAQLSNRDDLTDAEKTELKQNQDLLVTLNQLETSRRKLQDYVTYNSPNILIERIRNLRADSSRQVELRQTLAEFLRDEKSGVETRINLKETIGFEQLMGSELREAGGLEMEQWEREVRDKDREDELRQEQGEISFTNLPPFQVITTLLEHHSGARRLNEAELTQVTGIAGDNLNNILQEADRNSGVDGMIAVLERQVERYLYKAFRLGITRDVHAEFDEFYTQYKMPEIDYYGGVHRVESRHVQEIAAVLSRSETLSKYRIKGWDGRFFGVISYAAERAAMRMEDVIAPAGVDVANLDDTERALLVTPDLYLFRGEWDPERAGKKAEAIVTRRMFWEKSVTGYYQFKIDTDVSKNPYAADQLHSAADQWIAYMQSGVIPKNPQDQLREYQQFIGQLAPVAEKIYRQMYPEDPQTLINHPENRGKATTEIRKLRQGLKFGVEAPVAAYANAVDEAEAFASIHQTISEDVEGPEVWREGYSSFNGIKALALYKLENDPEYSRVYFHPEGSRGYLSANNGAQRLLEGADLKQLAKELAQYSLSDSPIFAQMSMSETINSEIVRLKNQIQTNENNPAGKQLLEKELAKKIQERVKLSKAIRKVRLERIGLDQPEEDFLSLYGKLDNQEDFKFLDEEEKDRIRKQKALEAEAAIKSAIDILNITGQISARGGPTFKIRNPQLLALEYKIEKINEMIDDDIYRNAILDIPEANRTEEQKKIAKGMAANPDRSPHYDALVAARAEHEQLAKALQVSKKVVDKREDRVPVRMAVRFAQYAVYRAEKVWAEEADRIMKSNLSKDGKDQAIQAISLVIIPDAWNVKKDLPNVVDRRLNLTDVLEGVYRDALDRVLGDWVIGEDGYFTNRVVGQGFRATLEVPVVEVNQEGQRRITKQILTDSDGNPLYLEDIDRLPESNGMLMAYYGTEEIMTNTISLPYKVKEAKAGHGGLLGRALRILDPAFNRLYREDNPADLRDFQKLQRAIHAAVEAQWQRHFQIQIEALERSVIGADIRKNKTGKIEDRYKIIDGNPRNNLLEFGRERLYVTGRIINHAAEVLTHADRRSRRAADLGLYSPMQHGSEYDESAVEDSREFFGLIDTMSSVQAKLEGSRIDFLYLKLKGMRWGLGYKQRVALESGPVEGGKQWTGLLEKVYTSGDRLNKVWDTWVRSYDRAILASGVTPLGKKEKEVIDKTADSELEDFISTAESVDEREKLSTDTLYPDLSYARLAQAPLWKDGVDPFLPDGILNFERRELGRDTLTGYDNGTSRHASGIWFERINQWRLDPRKGKRAYPGSARIIDELNKKRWTFGAMQSGVNVLKWRNTR